MTEFKGKVAVVTGAAAGIGRAIAERCAREGMRVVLGDVENEPLAAATGDLWRTGAEAIAVRTDVSKSGDVEALAQAALSRFGAVHLLFNNAGVSAGTTVWDSTLRDWQWVMGVNLWGVIHGVRFFLPIMLAQDTEAHVVNTASIAGLFPYISSAPYLVTKHAVVSLSEHLYVSLAQQNAKVKVSVLCPGFVDTNLLESARNRPAELRNPDAVQSARQVHERAVHESLKNSERTISPQEVADYVFKGIRKDQFYILTHPHLTPKVRKRIEAFLGQSEPHSSSLRNRLARLAKKFMDRQS